MNKAKEIILVRHGQSFGNVRVPDAPEFHPDDPPLTPAGLEQARALSLRFEPGDVDVIFASSLIRSVQTVYPAAVRLGRGVRLLAELMEKNTGIAMTDPGTLKKDYPLCDLTNARGGGWADEDDAHAAARAARAMDAVIGATGPGQRALVCSHGAIMGFMVRYLLGLSLPEPFMWEFSNCGVTSVIIREGEPPLLSCANDLRHLSAAGLL